MMNSKVGYVYLLDENCRIRWAGSGPAEEHELEALNNGVRKLLQERRISIDSELPAQEWTSSRTKGASRNRVLSCRETLKRKVIDSHVYTIHPGWALGRCCVTCRSPEHQRQSPLELTTPV